MKRKVKGANKVGISEIADAIGISKSTVSRALNNHPKISIETKQKVLKHAQRLGYKPNIPDLISNKKSKSIAIIIPHQQSLYLSNIIVSAREYAASKGYSLFVCESNYDLEIERMCIEQIKSLGILSLIYVAHNKSEELEQIDFLAKENFPLIIIHEMPLKNDVSTVMLDVHQSLFDGIKHLKSNGATRPALIIDEVDDSVNKQVASLYESMVEDLDMDYSKDNVITSSDNKLEIVEAVNRLLSMKVPPNAIIFGSYTNAYRAWHIINERKDIKENILLMSINSNSLMLNAKPNITYLNLQGAKLGTEAARQAIKQIKKKDEISTKVYFSRLIIKSSSIKK